MTGMRACIFRIRLAGFALPFCPFLLCFALLYSAQLGLAWLDSTRLSLAWRSSTRLVSTRLCCCTIAQSTPHNSRDAKLVKSTAT